MTGIESAAERRSIESVSANAGVRSPTTEKGVVTVPSVQNVRFAVAEEYVVMA